MRRPRAHFDLDLERSIALLPPDAAVKGLFFTDVIERVRAVTGTDALFADAGVTPRRWIPFFDYPYADWMRIAVVAARLLSPKDPPAEGVRELGRHAYDALLATHVGRVLFGVLGRDAGAVLRLGPRGYALFVNFGSITAEELERGRVRYRFRSFPGFIETYQVGIFEGVLRHCNAKGEVRIDMQDLANADVEVTFASDQGQPPTT
jgi:uncharacterized protein (TIGR02265 family)